MQANLWLPVAASLAGVVLLLLLLLLRLRRLSVAQEQQASALHALQRDVRALAHAAVMVGERVSRLEQNTKAVGNRLEELGVRQDQIDKAEEGERSVDQAIKLVHKGASVEELMEITGLTRGEAELVAMIHRLDREN